MEIRVIEKASKRPSKLALLFFVGLALAYVPRGAAQTALDRYVAAPDGSYKYALANKVEGLGYTMYVLEMTSQQWKTMAEVDHPVWKHWVTVVKPAHVASPIGFLFITGGLNGDPMPAKPDSMLVAMALSTNTIASEIRMVPNQPLRFADENKERMEDAIIAYTWDKFLRTGEENWPLRLPMTKSAVRAMDTVTEFCRSLGPETCPEKFVVAGGSKRGWTTWTTAATDHRVIAIAPMFIDLLNLEPSFDHHFRAYGYWAPSIHAYEAMNIMQWTGTSPYRKLLDIEDPYSYRDRLTMPKYLINASGDEFFLPDSSQFYFVDLKGEKYLRYVPNAGHGAQGSDARESLQAFYESIVNGTPRPDFSWTHSKDGTLRVTTSTKPSEVKLWKETNPTARDFRISSIGAAYTESALNDSGGAYTAKVSRPKHGWTAYFIELTYPTSGKHPLKFTTSVYVTPDFLPSGPPPKGNPPH
jgi:PhoPQ-activated pathogenicity-related protein